MKNVLILVLLLLCCNLTISGITYYVSSSGNNSSNGLSESTSWNSISKVNSSFSTFKPGDQILFKRGDVFYGTITVTSSGSAGNPILLGAYGSGAAPVISGFTTISGWTYEGNGIYSKPLQAESAPNMVIIDGVNTPMGRYPDTNVGWKIIQTANGSSSITGSATDLPSSPDWTGGEVVIRKNHWIIDRNTITSHSNRTINYTSASGYPGLSGYGYFIQNHLSTLTSFGEWYYNSSTSTFYMYFGALNPNTKVVKVSTLNQGVNIETKNNITLQNLTIQGANQAGVYISSSNYVTIQDCNILYSGSRAIFGYYGTSTNLNILNNVITDSQNDGIALFVGFTGATISGNTISNISLIAGMGGNGDGQGSGIIAWGSPNHIIEFNSLTDLGYNGITIGGNNVIVRNNFVNNFGLVKDDAGGIYEASDAAANSVLWVGQKIYNNIVLNGIGAPSGTPVNFGFTEGIYLDLRNTDILVQGNTVYNCNMGLFLHNCHEINIVDNTFYANRESQFQSYHDNYGPNDPARNLNIQRNIMISRDVTGPNGHPVTAIWIQSNANDADILLYGTSDYNYYTRPINETSNTNITITCVSGNACVNRSLEEWKNYTGQDAHSLRSAVSVNDANKIRFEYNASKSNKVVSLDGDYVDVKGAKYSGSLTLLPYTSVVLMVDPNPSTLPASPVFVSSSVQNATPTTLEMIYDLVLTNIIPAALAFTVIVNSTARPVNKVDISGTKVTLTLASPVIKGDVVTVSYTKPANNPLQTAAGGQAATIGAQVVTNNINTAIPVYVSSVIENATPNILTMSYNMALASIAPTSSAFSVKVNTASSTVNAVVVSGTTVQLTLSSAIKNGEAVTVAYTKPSLNQIQTPSGGQAATITAQVVTNNVNAVNPVYVSSAVENATPTILEMTFNMTLANIVPSISSFTVLINSVARTVSTVIVSGVKVKLTLANRIVAGDIITVSYTKPTTNPIQTSAGGTATSISVQQVINNCINAAPTATITSPLSNSSFSAANSITITASALDADGFVTLVEFFNGSTKLGSKSSAPYTFNWTNVPVGNYSLTVIATDNLNAKTTSSSIAIYVTNSAPKQNQHPVVKIMNPSKGIILKNLSTVTINAIASDPDGSISKVEFYNGSVKLVELSSSPYNYTWKDVAAGRYSITAVATDNLNDTTISSPVEFEVGANVKYDANSDIIKLYPNPNNGHFSVEFINPLESDKSEIIITDLSGKQVYSGPVLKEETLKHIDVSDSRSGMYVMMIKDKEILVTKKFIKN